MDTSKSGSGLPRSWPQSGELSPAESSKSIEKLREMVGLLFEAQELVSRAREVERSFNYRVKLAEKVNNCVYPLAAVLDELELSLRRWS